MSDPTLDDGPFDLPNPDHMGLPKVPPLHNERPSPLGLDDLGPNMQRMDGDHVYMPDGNWDDPLGFVNRVVDKVGGVDYGSEFLGVVDRAVHNSPPPMDDVGGVDEEIFDEEDPDAPFSFYGDPNSTGVEDEDSAVGKEGKLRVFTLLFSYFPDALIEVLKASEVGADKYAPGAWRDVENGVEAFADAGARHVLRIARGDVFDQDVRFRMLVRHKAQVAWNFLASLQLELEEEELANYVASL